MEDSSKNEMLLEYSYKIEELNIIDFCTAKYGHNLFIDKYIEKQSSISCETNKRKMKRLILKKCSTVEEAKKALVNNVKELK
ncbi:MAG: hypothetical protein MHPSP_002619, partial [Paramarteilia canceri]